MNELIRYEEELNRTLHGVESQIAYIESRYLEATSNGGNVVHGWDGYAEAKPRIRVATAATSSATLGLGISIGNVGTSHTVGNAGVGLALNDGTALRHASTQKRDSKKVKKKDRIFSLSSFTTGNIDVEAEAQDQGKGGKSAKGTKQGQGQGVGIHPYPMFRGESMNSLLSSNFTQQTHPKAGVKGNVKGNKGQVPYYPNKYSTGGTNKGGYVPLNATYGPAQGHVFGAGLAYGTPQPNNQWINGYNTTGLMNTGSVLLSDSFDLGSFAEPKSTAKKSKSKTSKNKASVGTFNTNRTGTGVPTSLTKTLPISTGNKKGTKITAKNLSSTTLSTLTPLNTNKNRAILGPNIPTNTGTLQTDANSLASGSVRGRKRKLKQKTKQPTSQLPSSSPAILQSSNTAAAKNAPGNGTSSSAVLPASGTSIPELAQRIQANTQVGVPKAAAADQDKQNQEAKKAEAQSMQQKTGSEKLTSATGKIHATSGAHVSEPVKHAA